MIRGLELTFSCAEGDHLVFVPRGTLTTIIGLMRMLDEEEEIKEYKVKKDIIALISLDKVQFFLGDLSSEYFVFVSRAKIMEAIHDDR